MNRRDTLLTSLALAAASLSAQGNPTYEDSVRMVPDLQSLGNFSQGFLDDWGTHGFNGKTRYSIVEQAGLRVLHAQCSESASGLVKKQIIPLAHTPVLQWSWRVDDIYEGIDETKREGDDYPASLFVGVKTGLTMLSVRVIHYVWSSGQPQGSSWDSAFTGKVKQVAVRSGLNASQGQWYEERRNVKEDFKRYFNLDIEQLDSISLMTDCDNSNGQSEAYYGDILLVPEESELISLEAVPQH